MATGNDIGISQPAASTITMKVATITQDWNSTIRHQELLTIAGGESTLEIARVQATAPASTVMGLAVRIASGPSSAADLLARVNQGVGNSSAADIWHVRAAQSTAGDLRTTVYQSTQGDLRGTVYQSTQGDLRATIYQSTATDLRARVDQGVGNSSVGDRWHVNAHSSVQTGWSLVAYSTAGQSTNSPVLSSAATTPYVSAFTATSTAAGPITFAFTAGSTVLWPFTLWADGGVPNVSQSVSQPGYLFKGQADRPLEFRILNGSTATVYLAVTYRQE